MKRYLKKSDVLREGYIAGLKHASRILNEMIGNDGDRFIGIKEVRGKYMLVFRIGNENIEMSLLTEDTIDEHNSFDYLKREYAYLWRESDKSESLDDFIEGLTVNMDSSYYYLDDTIEYRDEANEILRNLPYEVQDEIEKIIGTKGIDYVDLQLSGQNSPSVMEGNFVYRA